MVKFGLDNANVDVEARHAIWRAICDAAGNVRFRFDVKAIHGVDDGLLRVNEVPDLATWQLVEALSLLCVILSSSEAKVHTVNLFGKTGPGNCQCSCRLDG